MPLSWKDTRILKRCPNRERPIHHQVSPLQIRFTDLFLDLENQLQMAKNDTTASLQETVRSLERYFPLCSSLTNGVSELNNYKLREKEFGEKEREINRKHSKTVYYQEELSKAQTQITMLESKLHLRTQEKMAFEQEILELRDRSAPLQTHNANSIPKRRVSHRSAVLVTQGNEVVESFESVVEELYERWLSFSWIVSSDPCPVDLAKLKRKIVIYLNLLKIYRMSS
jgi:chromosome segregation ATPase